jgi:hypothetical protein
MATLTPTRRDAAPYIGFKDARSALMNHKVVEMARHYSRPKMGHGDELGYCLMANPAARSAHNTDKDPALGLGWVKALCAILMGALEGADISMNRGKVFMRSISGSSSAGYEIGYQVVPTTDGTTLQAGPFTYGPTYQVAVAAFVFLFSERCPELRDRWAALVRTLRDFDTPTPDGHWTAEQINLAVSEDPGFRNRLEACADTLRWAYARWGASRNGPWVQYESLPLPGFTSMVALTKEQLLNPDRPDTRTTDPFPEVDEPIVERARVPEPDPEPETETLAPTRGLIQNAHGPRIRKAIRKRLPVMLAGPTSTGKTAWTQIEHLAWVSEGEKPGLVDRVVLTPDHRAEDVVGSNVPVTITDLETGTVRESVRWSDGPLLRVIRHIATTGGRGAFFCDEVALGHHSVIPLIMSLTVPVGAEYVRGQGLTPSWPDSRDEYLMFRVPETQEAFVIPQDLFRLTCAANERDGYMQTARTESPAFRRRLRWLEIGSLSREDTQSILCARLGLPKTHSLITALLNVHQAVCEYQAKEEAEQALVLTTNLDTLIKWGEDVLEAYKSSKSAPEPEIDPDTSSPKKVRTRGERLRASDPGDKLAHIFIEEAKDLWVDAVVPNRGQAKDPDVMKAILDILTVHKPRGVV